MNCWSPGHLCFFSFLRVLHTGNPFLVNKYIKNIKWDWMWLNDATWRIYLKSMKSCWRQQTNHSKNGQTHNIWNQQHNRYYLSKSNEVLFIQIGQVVQKLEPFKGWKTGRLKNFNHTLQILLKFREIARKCVKLNFRKWKLLLKLIELLTKNLRG